MVSTIPLTILSSLLIHTVACDNDNRIKYYILWMTKYLITIYEVANVNFSCLRLQAHIFFFQL